MKRKFATRLALLLAVSFSTAAFAWGERPKSADLPERNGEAAALELHDALTKARVMVVKDSEIDGRTPCQHRAGLIAAFTPIGDDQAAIILCDITTPIISDTIVLHEVAHAIQWCKSGRPEKAEEIKSLGYPVSEYTVKAVRHAASGFYSAEDFAGEAEAQSFAETTSLLGAARAVAKACKVSK